MEKLYQLAPHFIQNLFVTFYNFLAYKKRYGGRYKEFLTQFSKTNSLSLNELEKNQLKRLNDFIQFAANRSTFYKKLYEGIDLSKITSVQQLNLLPIVDKEQLRTNINEVHTITKNEGIVSKTGGTTGKSLEVHFTPDDMQERFAMLDNFRAKTSYQLGKKTAWFSGKNLLTPRDLNKNRFWKTDYLYHVNYYSTFHIKEEYLKYYVQHLLKFQPEYIVGFPSSILEIAKYGVRNNMTFPPNIVKAIFPTAETISDEMREYIEPFFKSKMFNQYASSEGAPFIFECEKGNLHFDMQSGVFEVLDDANQPANKGKMIVTSFTTHGTPLIRYDIGDTIELSDEICNCGNHNPLAKQILGRIDDFVYSVENGKINLGNVSNTLKDTKGIVKFQAIQDRLDEVEILIIVDEKIYDSNTEKIFIKNWKHRLGEKMSIKINYVSDIPTETSGKFRMVKNNIKHLIN